MSDDEDIPTLVDVSHDQSGVRDKAEALHEGEPKRVPLTIITGFLGAGKSTLLQYILTEQHGYRIAVIMNEFGDTADIESRAINVSSGDDSTQSMSEEFLEVANGCLCCSIKDSGAAAIEKLMKKKGKFDYILLETTGLADPGPIASIFWHNEDLSGDIILDGVVTVIDSVFGLKQIQADQSSGEVKESLRQIGCADVILVNKVDLVDQTTLQQLENTIRVFNPTAIIEQTVKGHIDLSKILRLDAYSSQPTFFETPFATESGERHDHNSPGHVHDESCTHLNDISSLLLPIPPLSQPQLERLDEWIRTLLWENRLLGQPEDSSVGIEVLRCKGMYSLEGGSTYVLQGVRTLYDTKEVAVDAGSGTLVEKGKIVLIGKGLHSGVSDSLRQALHIYD